jgi:hypothetical protein
MSYQRVIPRDLFNEANLLKCYGQLCLKLEIYACKNIELRHYGNHFVIEQNEDDGSLTIFNLQLRIRSKIYRLFRPLNSREPWPLYAQEADYAEWQVFTDDGELSAEFLELLSR